MRRIGELFTAWPFLGSCRLTAMLRAEGLPINRKRVQRLMRRMGIAALGPKPNTSKPAPGHKIYPYLLRGLAIERVNQVWAADSPTFRSGAAFSIWWRSSTGPAVLGEFGVFCSAPEPVHFFRVDAPRLAIPDVFRSVEGEPQPPGSAADGCLHHQFVRSKRRERCSVGRKMTWPNTLGYLRRRSRGWRLPRETLVVAPKPESLSSPRSNKPALNLSQKMAVELASGLRSDSAAPSDLLVFRQHRSSGSVAKEIGRWPT